VLIERFLFYIISATSFSFLITILIGITSLILKLFIPSVPLTISPINAIRTSLLEGIALFIVLIFIDLRFYWDNVEIDISSVVKVVYLVFSFMLYNIHLAVSFPFNYLIFGGLMVLMNMLTGVVSAIIILLLEILGVLVYMLLDYLD